MLVSSLADFFRYYGSISPILCLRCAQKCLFDAEREFLLIKTTNSIVFNVATQTGRLGEPGKVRKFYI